MRALSCVATTKASVAPAPAASAALAPSTGPGRRLGRSSFAARRALGELSSPISSMSLFTF